MSDYNDKILWKRPLHSDSYIPPGSFLSSLRKNRKIIYKMLLVTQNHTSSSSELSSLYLLAPRITLTLYHTTPCNDLHIYFRLCAIKGTYSGPETPRLDCFYMFHPGLCYLGSTRLPQQKAQTGACRPFVQHPLELFIQSLTADVTGAKNVKSSILIFLSLMSLSPVLRTLTAATSSDSIWALSASLFILNAVLADYSSSVTPNGPVNER